MQLKLLFVTDSWTIANGSTEGMHSFSVAISIYYNYNCSVLNHFPVEFPKLTDQHILNAFIDSGVTNSHVHQLGIYLGLSEDAMHTLKASNDSGPAIFALKTVNAWLKKDPRSIGDNIQETFVELENKLRQAHLNCVIGKLRRKETQSM